MELTLRKTHMEPEDAGFQKEPPFPASMLVFGGCRLFFSTAFHRC